MQNDKRNLRHHLEKIVKQRGRAMRNKQVGTATSRLKAIIAAIPPIRVAMLFACTTDWEVFWFGVPAMMQISNMARAH
jgi:hypothetical protein